MISILDIIVADGYMMGHLIYKVLLSFSAGQHFNKPATQAPGSNLSSLRQEQARE
jgi:hypothetical protein